MTEKRYYCNENLVVIDSKTEKSCSYFKCMNLLNEKEKEIKELEEENEQLKKQLDGICKSYSDYYGMSIRNAQFYGFKGDVE